MGTTLTQIADPDETNILEVDQRSLPPGEYQDVGFECRQVLDIDIRRVVIEYRAQILQISSSAACMRCAMPTTYVS